MTLQELIRSVTKPMSYQHGLVLLSVNADAAEFVENTMKEIPKLEYTARDDREIARRLRDTATQVGVWQNAMFVTHNPHSWFEMEADIAIHIWANGDNYLARLMKQRGVESRTITDDIVLDQV